MRRQHSPLHWWSKKERGKKKDIRGEVGMARALCSWGTQRSPSRAGYLMTPGTSSRKAIISQSAREEKAHALPTWP